MESRSRPDEHQGNRGAAAQPHDGAPSLVSTAVVAEFSGADVMSVAEAAEILHCSARHVYNLVARDELPGARHIGRSIVVIRPVLVSWLLHGTD